MENKVEQEGQANSFKRTAGIAGIITIVMGVVLAGAFPVSSPEMPEGFFTPIIAFEFIETATETKKLLAWDDASQRTELIEAMRLGMKLDYVFMSAYTLFLGLFSWVCYKISKQRRYVFGVAIAPIVWAADGIENLQLLNIMSNLLAGEPISSELELLNIFTWIKWGGIALIFSLLAPYLWKGGLLSKGTSLMATLSVLFAIIAFVDRSFINGMLSLSVIFVFAGLICFCFTNSDQALKSANDQ